VVTVALMVRGPICSNEISPARLWVPHAWEVPRIDRHIMNRYLEYDFKTGLECIAYLICTND